MKRENDIKVLMACGSTEKEAVKHLNRGTIVYIVNHYVKSVMDEVLAGVYDDSDVKIVRTLLDNMDRLIFESIIDIDNDMVLCRVDDVDYIVKYVL